MIYGRMRLILLKRVIKRPSTSLGRHTPIFSLLPLLCVAVLLLFLSSCGKDKTLPDDGGDTQEANVAVETPNRTLDPQIEKALQSLSNQVAWISEDLSKWEGRAPDELARVLLTAETWFEQLEEQTDKLRKAFQEVYKDDADAKAPGLEIFSKRLAQMSEVVRKNLAGASDGFQTSQEAVEKLKFWIDELVERADALPDSLPADKPDAEPSNNGLSEKFDSISADLGELSETVRAVSDTVDKISKGVEEIPKEPPNIPLWISAVSSVLGCLLLISLRIWPPTPRKADSVSPDEEDKTAQVYDMLKELLEKADALSERLDKSRQNDILEDIQFELTSVLNLLRKSQPAPSAKPETQYFKVTNSNVADGQPIYLQKYPIRSEICGTLSDDNPQTYSVFPAMSQTTDNGRSGVIASNVLYTGDIKQCFAFPKERPVGFDLYITVEEPALIRQAGSQYQLVKRGKLSVAGSS